MFFVHKFNSMIDQTRLPKAHLCLLLQIFLATFQEGCAQIHWKIL